MLPVVRAITKNFFLLRGYPGMCNLLDGLVALGCIMLCGMRDVKDMRQQMGYCSLEWNWMKVAMNIPIGALMEPSCINFLVNSPVVNS